MAPALHFPPFDYSLLFPDLLDFHMENNPSFPIFVYMNDASGALTEISFLEFSRAAHRVAHALRPSRQGPDGEVVMIIANTDALLYHVIIAGLSIAGWVPFPASPRNSVAAFVNMMKETNCSRILTLDHAHKQLIDDILQEDEGAGLTVCELPLLRYAFPKLGEEIATDPFIPYPSALKRPELDSPAIYIHSSGSTGFPKPIALTYRIQIQWLAHPLLGVDAELPSPRRVGGMALPPFHASGIVTQLYIPIASLVTAVIYPPHTHTNFLAQPVIPTSENILECLKMTKCNVLFTVPTFLEQMVTSEEAIEVLRNVDSVCFGGGPLPMKVGEMLRTAGVRLASCYSGTEFGPVAITDKQDVADGDWRWVRFLEDVKTRWVPQGNDTYELHILSTDERWMAVENLPDVKGYATADVFIKHPTKDMWGVVGRADDVITLASGEKTVPAPMESIIGSSPLVQGVIMFGRERNQVGVLIEPRLDAANVNDERAVAEFRDQIWPFIEEANKLSPTFSRIFKEMILITSNAKPMLRVAKGVVQRQVTLNIYAEEINTLYDAVEKSLVVPDGLAEPVAWTSEALEDWLLIHARAANQNRPVDPHTDLFAQGFDSLSATYLRNRLLNALRKSPDPEIKRAVTQIPRNIVFETPTIQRLSFRIATLVDSGDVGQAVSPTEQHKQAIDSMIEKYSAGLDASVDDMSPSDEPLNPAIALLTGTTGGLGSLLLLELLKNPSVYRVFALNRPSSVKSTEERQKSAFHDKGLPIDLLDSNKLVYVNVDASLEKCGLSPTQYEEIRNSVTLIIHNAWRLDFNLAMSSFEDSIRASRNLLDLGLNSTWKTNLRFMFTSSIGSAQSWDNSKGLFPEDVQLDPSVAVGTGYGESKYTTERIIAKSSLHATCLRIGQISGGPNGSWAATDWFPIIIQSSIALGVLPEPAGVVSWVRQEDVATVILETAFAKQAPPPFLNVSNPRSVPCKDIVAAVRRSIIKQKELEDNVLRIVPFGEWFALLESRAENASEEDLTKIPAIKLLEFFRELVQRDEVIQTLGISATEMAGLPNVSTSKAQQISPTMANMQAIGEVEAHTWVAYWISKGIF